MKLNPAPGYILVKPADRKQDQGFYTTIEETETIGEVLAVGEPWVSDEGTRFPLDHIKVGDKIVHRQMGVNKLHFERDDFRFIYFRDIIGKVTD